MQGTLGLPHGLVSGVGHSSVQFTLNLIYKIERERENDSGEIESELLFFISKSYLIVRWSEEYSLTQSNRSSRSG